MITIYDNAELYQRSRNDGNWFTRDFHINYWVGTFLVAIIIALIQEVILGQFGSSSHQQVNVVQVVISALIWIASIQISNLWSLMVAQLNRSQDEQYWTQGHDDSDTNSTVWDALYVWNLLTVGWLPMIALPMLRLFYGALGSLQQLFLRHCFYYLGRESRMSDINDPAWPVAPIYICNACQHDLIDASDVIGTSGDKQTYQHFEMTSQHWGSRLVGWWKLPRTFFLSSAMEMSGAATSGTVGNLLEKGWVEDMFTKVMATLGGETGRYHQLRQHGRGSASNCVSPYHVCHFSFERLPELIVVWILCISFVFQIYALFGFVRNPFRGMPDGSFVYEIMGTVSELKMASNGMYWKWVQENALGSICAINQVGTGALTEALRQQATVMVPANETLEVLVCQVPLLVHPQHVTLHDSVHVTLHESLHAAADFVDTLARHPRFHRRA